MSDALRDLSRPFPSKYVHKNPSGGGSYVGHEVVTQRLLQVCGPFSFEVAQVIRGHVPEILADPSSNSKRGKEGRPALTEAVVGIVGRLTVEVDGRTVRIEEAGDCEDPHNWPHDGARMKDACSDSIKRCAMRLGLGIHLWAQNEFFLYEQLGGSAPAEPTSAPPDAPKTQERSGEATQSHPDEQAGSLDPSAPSCPNCNGPMWDNRVDKRNPKAPDFKCKDKNCDGVIWPPRSWDNSQDQASWANA